MLKKMSEWATRRHIPPPIGVGIGYRRPRPPNRTCGFPAYGSPVGGFFIETVSLRARPCKARTARHSRGRHDLPPVTSLPTPTACEWSIRRLRPTPSCNCRLGFCTLLSLSALAVLLCSGMDLMHPPSCPAFPWTGFASPSFNGPCIRPQRYYAGSDSCCASPTPQVSPFRPLAFPTSRPQPRYAARSSRAYHLVRPVDLQVRLRLQ